MDESIQKRFDKDNPLKWVENFAEYVIDEHKDFDYWDFVLLKEDAPLKAQESYKKYIKLLSKAILTWDNIIIENWEIKGFEKADSPRVQEQCNIVMELIEKGIINKVIKR